MKAIRALPRYTVEHLLTKQLADPTLRTIRSALELPPDTSKAKRRDFIAGLTETEKKWFNKNKERLRINEKNILVLYPSIQTDPVAIVLPEFFRFEIMQETHDQLGHQGANKTAEKMARDHQWPGYREDVKRHVASCMRCQEAKPPQRTLRTKLQPIITTSPGKLAMIDYEKANASLRRERWCADDGGPLLRVLCRRPGQGIHSPGSSERHLVSLGTTLCGIPDVVHSDKGSHFENALMQELLSANGVREDPHIGLPPPR